jgi:PhoH-like ATPase
MSEPAGASPADSEATLYVPDTSALIENPDALDRLLSDGNAVVLLHQVIEELGRLQSSRTKSDGVRAAARAATRKILQHRGEGTIHHDIDRLLSGRAGSDAFQKTTTGGVLGWEPAGKTAAPYADASGDNLIVAAARRVARMAEAGGYRTVLISEDSNLLLKCDAVGLDADRLRYGKVEIGSPEDLPHGHLSWQVEPATIAQFDGSGPPGARFVDLSVLPGEIGEALAWNTGVTLWSEGPAGRETRLTRAEIDGSRLEDLRHAQYWDRKRELYRPRPILGLRPRDVQQTLAMEFLLDPAVQLIVLDGPAGSGKTRLMVAAALQSLTGRLPWLGQAAATEDTPRYDNGLVLVRPEHPSSQYDMGYLPGDYDNKVAHWLEPLLQHVRALSATNEHAFLDELRGTGRLHMLSTSMLRGLDIDRSIVLVDELQNGDRHLAKTLMSRFCETSKVVLAGCLDPVQIDNPYVDWASNALSRIKQTYRGFGAQVAQVTLSQNYRGAISQKADEL